MTRPHDNRGLSLLEMLVVLSMISMVSTVLFQGYGYMLANYQRIQLRQADESQRMLANSWFRDSLENLVAYKKGKQRFRASATRISGTTFSPLLSRSGVPTAVRWELRRFENRQQLHYLEQSSDLVIASWPAGTGASFRFRDVEGNWSESWNEASGSQLPTAIELALEAGESNRYTPVTAIVRTKLEQDRTVKEELRELGF